MADHTFQIHQLADELSPPDTGKQTLLLLDDAEAKVMLFSFAAGAGLAEHVAPLPAILHIVQGEAAITVREEAVAGKPGTWIQMAPRTPHSIQAVTPVVLLLTLLKQNRTPKRDEVTP